MIIGGWRGPGWQVFDADPRLGSQIRDWISSAVSGHDCPVDAADAALVVHPAGRDGEAPSASRHRQPEARAAPEPAAGWR